MKYWVKLKTVSDTKATIIRMVNTDYLESEGVTTTEQATGRIYDESDFPVAEERTGFDAYTFQNPQTGELYAEYVQREPTDKEKIVALEAASALMQAVLDDLILNGGVI